MTEQAWNLEDDLGELPTGPGKPRTANPDTGSAHPINVIIEQVPLIAQFHLLHIQVAFAVPVIIFIGTLLYFSRFLPEILVGSSPLGFLIGLWLYFDWLNYYQGNKDSKILKYFKILPSKPSGWFIVLCTAVPPLVIFVGSAIVVWGRNRFLAAAFPAALTWFLFFSYGDAPIKFFEQLLLSQPPMPTDARTKMRLPECGPNLPLLALLLMGMISFPILFSNTVALMLLTFALCAYFCLNARFLWQMAPRGAAVRYFLTFAYRVAQWFLNYPEVYPSKRSHEDLDRWAPPFSQSQRRLIAGGLTASLLLTLIVDLSYYCPWEFFAKLSTDLPAPSSSGSAFDGYSWLFMPFTNIASANPLAAYLPTFVFAIAGGLILPPAILIAIYLPRLIELEQIHQQVKAMRSETLP